MINHQVIDTFPGGDTAPLSTRRILARTYPVTALRPSPRCFVTALGEGGLRPQHSRRFVHIPRGGRGGSSAQQDANPAHITCPTIAHSSGIALFFFRMGPGEPNVSKGAAAAITHVAKQPSDDVGLCSLLLTDWPDAWDRGRARWPCASAACNLPPQPVRLRGKARRLLARLGARRADCSGGA